jgi:hypothetical protein
MTPRHGPAAAFRWLADALDLLRRQPGPAFLAGLVLVLLALAPSLLQLQVQRVVPAGGSALQMLFSALGLVLMPPVLGGFFRLMRALERGEPARLNLLWSPFAEGGTAWRLILCNLLYAVATVAALVALAYALGGPALFDYLRALSTLKPNATAADLPPLPDGTLLLVGVMLLVALFVTTAQQLSAARIARCGAPGRRAAAGGTMSTLRNALPFALLYAPLMVFAMLAIGVLGVVAGVLFMALSLASKSLAVLVLGVLLLSALALVYALMLAFFYCAWRVLSGVAPVAGALPPSPPHEIAA